MVTEEMESHKDDLTLAHIIRGQHLLRKETEENVLSCGGWRGEMIKEKKDL